MGIATDIAGDWQAALAALGWQVDLGVVDAVGDDPVDRYEAARAPAEGGGRAGAGNVAAGRPEAGGATAGGVAAVGAVAGGAVAGGAFAGAASAGGVAAGGAVAGDTASGDAVAAARQAAGRAGSLVALRAALEGYEHCAIKAGARNLVFADGLAGARVLVLGEAPGVEEDREGRPFVGRAGQLLDRMFAAIGLSRSETDPARAIYITNVMPWRPPQNRDPEPAEIAMMRPFVERHIALADPEVIVLMGNTPCAALLGARGITRLRGIWTEAQGRPVLPMFHPAYLLRQPAMKAAAWADLLTLQARLRP